MKNYRLTVLFVLAVLAALPLSATLTVTPITWNIVGLDSNSPASGPHLFPVGVRVCSDVATTNVAVNFLFDTANANVNLRAGSLNTITIPSIGAGLCSDAYFEVDVTQTAAAYDTKRRYHITAADGSGTFSSPTPRELYVEHLISQSRNSVNDVKYGPVGGPYASVAAGGTLALVVGNTYDIQLFGGTATQGYNQFEEFINFPNTIFQVLGVNTTYSADNSPYVPNPNNKLYADACLWENDPNSPNYRNCVGGDFKAGGSNVVTTYTVKILSGGGTNQTLGSLLYDFSGSSYHYNADFGVGARIAAIIDPTAANISKSFSPNPASLNGVSTLTITLTNPNGAPVGDYNVVDNLPANLVVATPNGATTSGCGTPGLTATAGSSTITFSNGTVAANGNCVINVNVTPTATGTLVNTTNHLFIGATDTGKSGNASLTVNTAPPPGTGLCGSVIAKWTFPTGFTLATPAPTTNTVTATANAGPGVTPLTSTNSTTTADGTSSWGSNGNITTGTTLVTANDDYFQFVIDTTGLTSVVLSFDALRKTPNGPAGLAVFHTTTAKTNSTAEPGAADFNNVNALPTQNVWATFSSITISSGLNPAGNTFFRIYPYNSGNTNSGSDSNIDNVTFAVCTTAIKPTIAKSFSPNPITLNGVSTLTFTLTNTNTAPLTGAAFTDTLPGGTQVAATPSASTTCTGATWAPAAAATSLTFSGGTIPASGSCTVSVNVTATTAGPHANISSNPSTTESGTTTDSIATASLTAVLPPSIAKQFAPNPILAGGVSTLTFAITNPNPNNAISGVAFNDTFPTSPAAMVVAATPAATTNGCGAPTFAPVAGAGSIAFSGATIAAGGTCLVTVNITAPVTGTYNNTSGSVSHIINSATVNGNTASGSLTVTPPHPSIGLLKQIGLSPTGPWTNYAKITTGTPVYYQFTVENTGDVPLSPINITDDTLNVSTCNATFSSLTLPVAVAANNNHIVTCVVGPVSTTSGLHTNTAHATGTFSGTPYNSPNSLANYATTGLTLVKSATESTFTLPGDVLHYSYLVTNSGFAPLVGPVTVADNKTTVTCPSVTTVGDLDNYLDPGESITCTATYTITGTDVANAAVTNTATATAESVNSNSSSKTVPLSTSADVSMVKTLTTAGPYFAGSTISYTLVVANGGPSTATSIQVTDTPTNLTITNISGSGCSLPFPCTIASLASGANTTITVTATINAAGAFDNSATATAAQPDPNPGNNTDNTGNGGNATLSADLVMVKTLTTAGPFYIGNSIQYSLQVTNNGPSAATNVQVSDTPSNMTITNVTGGGCSLPLPCNIGTLANGASATITVTATINATGAFDNSATVSATEPDPNSGNNTDNTGNNGTALPKVDVSMVKTLTTAGPFHAGDSIQYSLVVANAGPSTATNISVTDTPTNLTITNVTGSGCSLPLPCTIASLAASANTTITVTATINAAGAFDNSATATPAEFDTNTGNNTDNTGNNGTAVASADVSIVKTLTTSGPYHAGDSIQYSLVVANAGPSTATSIQVTDTPSNLTLTNVTGSGCSLPFPCTIASLASGTNTTITVTATIIAAGAFDNTATANAAEFDPNTGNNTDNTGNGGTAVPSADVSVVKTLTTAGPYHFNDTIQYTLVVANGGPSAATNIQVTDAPTNLSITNVTGGGCSALPCTIASLANGANVTITVTATITATGTFDNSATVTATEFDPNTGNNTDNTGNSGTATALADVSLVKTLTTAGPFHLGDSIQYTLAVHNAGPSTATNVQITDTPTNLTITNVTGAGCVALPCTLASLASGATATITVTSTINATGAFDNTATATATEPDPNSGNNTDSTGNGGNAVASADVSVVKTLTTAAPYAINQTGVTYSLVVANAGPSTATNVQVTDTPTNLTITNVSGGGCSALPCTIPSLASGASVTITVTVTITGTTFDNSTTVSATEFDPNTGNNTDNTGNAGSTGQPADMQIVKTLTTSGPFMIGQSITYTLQVTNNGPANATAVQITDSPTNLSITNVSGGGCSALPCTIASMPATTSVTITVNATITAVGAFDNSASVFAAEGDPNLANNTDSTGNGGNAVAAADVSMVKTLTTAGPFVPGQTINYTLTVANAGPSTATNVQVTDTPTNLTITGVTGSGCSLPLPCTIASLASAASTNITVTATINAAGAFDNSATATATESDPNPVNNTDNTGNGGTATSADVSVVKTLTTAGPYLEGQTIAYTLLVANGGPSTATSIQVTDTPSNLTITGVSGACTALPCTIASLASGANTTINVSARINAPGAFDNTATVSAAEPDPNLGNNTDSTGNGGTAAPVADVSIVKTLTTAGPFTAGQSITYTLLVANGGPSTATSIQVTDTPTNLTITNVSGAGCAALPCTIPSLANGANVTITVTATINASGAFDNTATATAVESDPNLANNTDNTGNNGLTGVSADVSMVKTLTTAGPFSVGQTIGYTLVVANAGPSTATNVQVTDTPTHLTISNVTGACTSLPCTIASIASGANVTITVTAQINASGAFDNSATATATEADPNPVNNTDSTGNGGNASQSADVSIVKTLTTAGPFAAGQQIAYTLVVANAGPSAATSIQVTDTPTNLTINTVTGACSALPCTIASLAMGANVTINVTATINATGAFDNSASAFAVESDPNLANNTDNTGNGGSAGSQAVDVMITKTANVTQLQVGGTLNYTLTIHNNGPGTATGVTVTDPLPTSYQLQSATSSQGSCSGTTTVTCSVGTMLNGATVTITLHGIVTQPGNLTNTATVTANESETSTANNSSVTGVAVVSATAIPTLSEYGLMLMVIFLGMAAVVAMKR